MMNRSEKKVRVRMNVVPRSAGNTNTCVPVLRGTTFICLSSTFASSQTSRNNKKLSNRFWLRLIMFWQTHKLRAAAWKIQTSPDSSKKSASILFHKKNPHIELFSKMEFKRFSEFHFSRNGEMSDFAQMGFGANPKICKFLRMLSSLAKQDKKRN